MSEPDKPERYELSGGQLNFLFTALLRDISALAIALHPGQAETVALIAHPGRVTMVALCAVFESLAKDGLHLPEPLMKAFRDLAMSAERDFAEQSSDPESFKTLFGFVPQGDPS